MRLEQILEDYTNNIETLYQDVKTELVIDDSLIEQELRNQPGKYFHWAYLATIAERRYQFLEAEFKKIAASCFQSVRLMEDGGKKLTEAAVKEKATLQKAYLDAEQAVIGAETVYHALKSAEKSMDQRGSMLQSLNARQQKEMRAAGQTDRYGISEPENDPIERYREMKSNQNN